MKRLNDTFIFLSNIDDDPSTNNLSFEVICFACLLTSSSNNHFHNKLLNKKMHHFKSVIAICKHS